jgi:Intracellular proteinase inhibitor
VYAKRKRPFSTLQFALTVILVALLFLLALAAITREAVGEPIVPEKVMEFFHKSDTSSLPQGFAYDFEILDPVTQRSVPMLPPEGTVELRLAVTNQSPLPMTLQFPTSLQCEFITRRVETILGGLFVFPLEVWRSSYFHNISHQPTTLTFAPGETKVFTALWTFKQTGDEGAPNGDYRALAKFYGATFSIRIDKPQ